MKKLFIILGFIIMMQYCYSNTPNPEISKIINLINLDTLLKNVSQFTGEEDVFINDSLCRISSRMVHVDSGKTYLAEQYLIQKFKSYNYLPKTDTFSYWSFTTKGNGYTYNHVYAEKKGIKYPDKKIYFCAHLDCVGDYKTINYGADDNASGTSVVLEAARVLSDINTDYTIVFMLFNSEETNANSLCHFDRNTELTKDIKFAINNDMLAWDSNFDNVFSLCHDSSDYSKSYTTIIKTINNDYSIGLVPKLYLRPVGDVYRFSYPYKIPSLSFIEDCIPPNPTDMNKYYHSNNDRIIYFNIQYYHKMAKLSIASLACMAMDLDINSIKDNDINKNELNIYPNPAKTFINIDYTGDLDNIIDFSISDIYGNILINHDIQLINNSISLDSFPSGCYIIKIMTKNKIIHEKFHIVK